MDILDFVKNICKIELLPWQEELLIQYETLQRDGKLIFSTTAYYGRSIYADNFAVIFELLTGEKLKEIRASDIDPNKQDGRMGDCVFIETI